MPSLDFEISNLTKTYSGHPALDGLDIKIEKGSMNFLLGANGSGKSTLIKCLAGHENWDTGEILLKGQSRRRDRRDFNKGLHLVSEDILPPQVSLLELKSLYKALHSEWNEEVFQKFISWGNLSLSQNLNSASRGQKIQGLLSLACSVEILAAPKALG